MPVRRGKPSLLFHHRKNHVCLDPLIDFTLARDQGSRQCGFFRRKYFLEQKLSVNRFVFNIFGNVHFGCPTSAVPQLEGPGIENPTFVSLAHVFLLFHQSGRLVSGLSSGPRFEIGPLLNPSTEARLAIRTAFSILTAPVGRFVNGTGVNSPSCSLI